MSFIRPPTSGAKFDYSKINQITASMKEKLKQKYETMASLQEQTEGTVSDNSTQSSVLDNYITDIETLFLDGVFNGDLRVNGTVYATKIELEDTVSSTETKETVPLLSFGSTQQWIDKYLKKVKIEDSDLWRCRMYNADFVNETLFRDNVRMERNLNVLGTIGFNGDFSIDTNTFYVNSVSNQVGIGTSTPNTTLDVNGNISVSGNASFDGSTLYIDSSNNRVGIGLTNPTVSLDVSGTVLATTVSATTLTGMLSTAAQPNITSVGTLSSLSNSGTSQLTGNVGIGKASTSNALDVSGSSAISGNLTVKSNVLVVDTSNNRVGIGLINPSTTLDISGNVNTNGKLRESGNNLIPRGIIVAWFGNSTSVPAGWALCNGQNGTPDLRGRFILGINPSGANNSSFTTRDVSGTGGVETVTLTIAQMPSHTHDAYLPRGDTNWTSGSGNTIWGGGTGYSFTTQATGGGQAHENMPPFFALAYIMKL